MDAGGSRKMIPAPTIRPRQPKRERWSMERLVHEWALTLGEAIDLSTKKSYGSALNSYLNFILLHDLPAEPTDNTLSLFTVYMSFYIKPDSVDSYLSGIVQQLEPYFPDVWKARKSLLVCRTLSGCKRMRGSPIKRKRALTLDDLGRVIDHYSHSTDHNTLLFLSMLLTGFFALMRLGELTFPDDKSIRDWCKVIKRASVHVNDEFYEFHLPHHKADHYFEGNRVIVQAQQFRHNPLFHFQKYLTSCLWLMARGHVPTCSFFINRLWIFFDGSVAGQSMHAGGATSLAENGVPPSIIQPLGQWSSSAFLIYIQKSPTLIQAMLYSNGQQTMTTTLH